MINKHCLILVLITVLTACGLEFNSPDDSPATQNKPRLNSLQFVPLEIQPQPLEKPALVSLRNAYLALMDFQMDSETTRIVRNRLANLNMLIAEQQQERLVEGQESDFYRQAIEQYQQILSKYPQQNENQDVLYQLAKAYDLQGNQIESQKVLTALETNYPNSTHLAEVLFRQGEYFYSEHQYSKAIDYYQQVITKGNESAFYHSAAYMLGWSLVKTEQTKGAINAFSLVLEDTFSGHELASHAMPTEQQMATFTVGKRRLIQDTVNIMARLFSYSGAELAIAAYTKQHGETPYIHMLFEQLGQLLLNEDRFRDSAQVYGTFAKLMPHHVKAPELLVRQIDAYILGEFPSLVLPAKHRFVQVYGITGAYWPTWDEQQKDRVSLFILEYIQELAQFEHSKAQGLLNKDKLNSVQSTAVTISPDTLTAFNLAADLYRQFLATFPHHPDGNKMLFNLAESLNESQQFALAIEEYEKYAYQVSPPDNANEAGYAAILAYRQLLASSVDTESSTLLTEKKLASQARFTGHFPSDPRALDVQFDTMQQRFNLQQYSQAISAAEQLLNNPNTMSAAQQQSMQLVYAHSLFALERYQEAEAHYSELVLQKQLPEKMRLDLQHKLAASIYKQGERLAADAQFSQAVDAFLRVLQKAPTSDISVNAHFDAANLLITLKNWSQASSLLIQFRQTYPKHSLTNSIADKLIYVYQQSERWLPAAIELEALWQLAPKTEAGQNALFVSAQYYLDAGERQKSLVNFRRYAHQYPTPFSQATEARYQMSEFYVESGEDSKRRYWLNKLIQADASAGKARTERSQYLAAMARLVFANDAFDAFKGIKLTLPLDKSLQRKNTAMQQALQRYEAVLQYKVLEFDTAARYKIADVYHQLSKDLLSSSRPEGLNELELEQYDILLEEQAYPFEEQSIELHEANALRSEIGIYDDWTKRSYAALTTLLPGRYNKQEQTLEITNEIY